MRIEALPKEHYVAILMARFPALGGIFDGCLTSKFVLTSLETINPRPACGVGIYEGAYIWIKNIHQQALRRSWKQLQR